MVMTWGTRLAPLLSTMSLAWCVLIGGWFWFTPIRHEAIHNGVTVVRYQSFSDISLLGPAPLIAPVLIAAVAVWASWRSHLVLGVAAFLLAVFTFIGGFSIGAGYLPASGLLLLAAALAPLFGCGQRKSVAA